VDARERARKVNAKKRKAEKPKAEMQNVRSKYYYVSKYESSDPQSPSSRSSQKENRCP
jgi:hypothetical protein